MELDGVRNHRDDLRRNPPAINSDSRVGDAGSSIGRVRPGVVSDDSPSWGIGVSHSKSRRWNVYLISSEGAKALVEISLGLR